MLAMLAPDFHNPRRCGRRTSVDVDPVDAPLAPKPGHLPFCVRPCAALRFCDGILTRELATEKPKRFTVPDRPVWPAVRRVTDEKTVGLLDESRGVHRLDASVDSGIQSRPLEGQRELARANSFI